MRTSKSSSSSPRLLVGTLVLGMLALGGVVGNDTWNGFSSRMEKLEGRVASAPRERAQLQRALEAVQAEVEAIRTELLDAQASQAAAVAIDERLHGAESMLNEISGAIEAHGSSLEVLEESTASFGPETLEARIAERDRELSEVWDALRDRLDAAEDSAALSAQRLDEVGATLASDQRDVVRMWNELVGPTVQLAGETSVGSGVLLSSRSAGSDATGAERFDTYVLTAWHVVRDILEGELDDPVPVTIYLPDSSLRFETATLGAHDAAIDVAVLRLDTDEPVSFGTELAPREAVESTRIFDRVYAVGCPLGNDPIPTPGEVSTLHHLVDDVNYWMINAPTYIGNSGGGIFDADNHQLLGLFSKIYTHGALRPTIVPHMGLVTPLSTVYDWMDGVGYGHLVPSEADQVADAEGR
ncbi:MAG: trypsin-like peptidase domain-containing protein [Planctomycetota bacterium]